MTDPDYFPKKADPLQAENAKRFPPRHKPLGTPPGEDFFSLVSKHGRPVGPFEHGRQRPYGAIQKP